MPIVPNAVAAAMHCREDASVVAALEPIALPRTALVKAKKSAVIPNRL